MERSQMLIFLIPLVLAQEPNPQEEQVTKNLPEAWGGDRALEDKIFRYAYRLDFGIRTSMSPEQAYCLWLVDCSTYSLDFIPTFRLEDDSFVRARVGWGSDNGNGAKNDSYIISGIETGWLRDDMRGMGPRLALGSYLDGTNFFMEAGFESFDVLGVYVGARAYSGPTGEMTNQGEVWFVMQMSMTIYPEPCNSDIPWQCWE